MGGDGYRVTAVDELDPVPCKPGLALRPIRSVLGLRAFGAGVYVGEACGDMVIEPHRSAERRLPPRADAMALALAAAVRDTEAVHWLNRAIGEVPELEREAATDLTLARPRRRGQAGGPYLP